MKIEMKRLYKVMDALRTNSIEEFKERWNLWDKDFALNEVHEVVGALLARQVTLFIKFTEIPSMWNWHIAPSILRTMIDTHINLAWILGDPLERSRKYISYGLGQTKLEIEHRKIRLNNSERDKYLQFYIDNLEKWLESQRWSFLTEVNIGSWTGLSTREMAKETGIIDFYNYCYVPFSAGTHSQWHHTAKYNLIHCMRPLHRFHKIPIVEEDHSDIHVVELAAKYMCKSFDVFDKKYKLSISTKCTYDKFIDWLSAENRKKRIKWLDMCSIIRKLINKLRR